ncbi:ribosomal protein S4/S9 amino-terminal domain protein [Medicago truncatula]|uniref:Ribosomal protein S4/S9 amino-terminal domain protein n=1 Tax=Medicago truncatula TaxID=3880 RepID=G7K0M5_MEDTR|nr:ribosomal protein S4/S9 amino-terminal domain protein [Medicago truncatula]
MEKIDWALPDYIVNCLRLEENLETNCARVKKSQYHIRLEERQKMCFHHGLRERQFLNMFVSLEK